MWHERSDRKKEKQSRQWYVTNARWDQPRNGAGPHQDKKKERERRACRNHDPHKEV